MKLYLANPHIFMEYTIFFRINMSTFLSIRASRLRSCFTMGGKFPKKGGKFFHTTRSCLVTPHRR